MFTPGLSYKHKVTGKIYMCKKSHDGYIRLWYYDKKVYKSICVSPGFGSGLEVKDFEVV